MLLTNQTAADYWFGPLHLPAGLGQTLTVDDTSETSLYLLDDTVADAINNVVANLKVTVSGQALPFPRATGVPSVVHGDGPPEGAVYAPQGSIYLRDSTVAAYSLYSKTTGVATSTGWWAVGTSGLFNVATTFPLAPTTGSAFVLNTGQSFITFVYDGTHWYSEPILDTFLVYNSNLTQTDAGPTTELADGGRSRPPT